MRFRVSLLIYLMLIGIRSSSVIATQPQLHSEELEQFITVQLEKHRIPGLAVAITKGDEVIYVQGFGSGITPQTQFFIASVSKSITAMAVMQLVEAGQIDLDLPVQTYLPNFTTADPTMASHITVRHVLNQTSGLADTGFVEHTFPQPQTIAEHITNLKHAESVAEPGSRFHYFNANYAILARLVEVVSGQAFEDYLQAHIFEPLNMTNTYSAISSDSAQAKVTQLAQGHMVIFGQPIAVDEMSGYLAGSGGVVSSAEDLAHFLIAQYTGRYINQTVISTASLELMHTPPTQLDTTYAMGWLRSEYQGIPIIEHNGILSVFYAETLLLPESRHGIVLLYNVNSLPSALIAFPQIKHGLINILVGREPTQSIMTVPRYALCIGLFLLIGIIFKIRSLLRIHDWRKHHHSSSFIRLLPSMIWNLVPLLFVLLMPQLVALTGRVFSMEQLFRFMPSIFIWLGVIGILGIVINCLRISFWLKDNQARHKQAQ